MTMSYKNTHTNTRIWNEYYGNIFFKCPDITFKVIPHCFEVLCWTFEDQTYNIGHCIVGGQHLDQTKFEIYIIFY